MPRPARTIAQRWNDIVNVNMIPEGIYNLIGEHVYCSYCTVTINWVTERNILRHHRSQLHQTNALLRAVNPLPSEDARAECLSRTHAFYYDLAEAFMAADIPFEKLNNAKLVAFLEDSTMRKMPDPSTMRKTYTDLVFEKKIQQVRDEVGDYSIYLSVDETNDLLGRLITHAIVAPLIPGTPGIPRMIHCAEISVGNAAAIVEFVEQSLSILWPNGIRREKLLLFVSDAAPYMMAAGRSLKNDHNYAKLVHVSCLAHGLHRVAEEIRGTYVLANDVIAVTKSVFLKSPSRKRRFCEISPGVPLPPQPVTTRWGEWLKAATYYHDHFDEVQAVIERLEPDAATVNRAQQLWENPNLEEEFNFIHTHYHTITDTITQLEERGMSLENSIDLITQVAARIQDDREIPANIKQRMQSVLQNNSGFSTDLMNIFQCLQGVQNVNIPVGWNIADVNCMTHAPTTSCEVERSFSYFKSIFRSNRQSFTTANLAKYVIVYFNRLQYGED